MHAWANGSEVAVVRRGGVAKIPFKPPLTKTLAPLPHPHITPQRIRLEVEDEGIPSTTLREIAVLRQLRHPNIVE